jgi:hypothetical protein
MPLFANMPSNSFDLCQPDLLFNGHATFAAALNQPDRRPHPVLRGNRMQTVSNKKPSRLYQRLPGFFCGERRRICKSKKYTISNFLEMFAK